MDRLPQEVIDRIVFFLPDRPTGLFLFAPRPPSALPQLATVSTRFQAAVERRTFQSLSISSGGADLQQFQAALGRGRRRACLRRLAYGVVLPAYGEAAARRVESEEDRAGNDAAFTAAIRDLFDILRGWDEGGGADEGRRPGDLALCVGSVSSPSDAGGGKAGLGDYRHLRSRVRLRDHEALPVLSCVTSLLVGPAGHRRLAPSTSVLLAARLPRLRALHATAYAGEMRYPAVARGDRHEMAAALAAALARGDLGAVAEAGVAFDQDGGPDDQLLALPDLLFPEASDPLGDALRRWAQGGLRELRVEGVFDGSLFWPGAAAAAAAAAAAPPTWTRLERLDVRLERNTPSGWWYFMPRGRPAYGTPARDPAADPADQPPPPGGAADVRGEDAWALHPARSPPAGATLVRNVPCEETMRPLLEAWARALGAMPALREARLAFRVEMTVGTGEEEGAAEGRSEDGEEELSMEDWEVVYQAPDVAHWKWHGGLHEAERDSRRLFFHNTRGWRPGETAMGLLREAGRDRWRGTKIAEIEVDEWDRIVREKE